MNRRVVWIVAFALTSGTVLTAVPRSVEEIPVFQGALRDIAAEGDFMQFASGVARVYRTAAPIEEVFAFYKNRLNAKSGEVAGLTGSSAPAAGSSEAVTFSVDQYSEDEENPAPGIQRKSIREVYFSWTTAVKDGSVAEFVVELLNAREENSGGAQARRGTRINMSQVGVMAQAQTPPSEDDDKKWLASLLPPKIPELDHWRDVMVIRGTWAFGDFTSGVSGPLLKGTGTTGGSGLVTLKRAPLDRSFPSQLKFTGPIDGTAFIYEQISFIEGTTTESGGCGGSLIGQDKGFSSMSVTLDLDDGTYSFDLSGTVGGCSEVEMQVTGQDVSYEADTAAFTVMSDVSAAPPKIPRDGLYLSLSSPAMIVAGHGLPLVGKGRVIVQLGKVPDGLYAKLKRKAQEEEKKEKNPPKEQPPKEKPPKEEPPKEDKDPNIIRIKAFTATLRAEPDWMSDPIWVVRRNQEVRLIEKEGSWKKVEDLKSGQVGWIDLGATTQQTIDWDKMIKLGGQGPGVTAGETELGGRG